MSDLPLTITSTNAVFMLTIAGLYLTPQKIQGFGSDSAFAVEAITLAEVSMGVDAQMSAGYTPMPTPQTITLQPTSASLQLFEDWGGAMKAAREVYIANGSITLPAIGRKYTLTKGILTKYRPIPDVKKVLEPVDFEITWESVIGAVA